VNVLLSSQNPIPLHIQLKDTIAKEISSHLYEEKIPSERELMERFQVSRATVREAINHLVQEQVLEKVQGKGTFIKKRQTIHEWLDHLHSFTETVERMGMVPSAKLLKIEESVQDAEKQKQLKTKKIVSIARLRKANEIPIAIERHFYGEWIGQQLLKYDLNKLTIYDLLEKQLHIELVEAEQTIKVIPIDREDAKALNIEANANVLCVERQIYGSNGEVIELYSSIFHPNYYELKVKTHRKMERRV
jgi:GntR family transcriptional regulator